MLSPLSAAVGGRSSRFALGGGAPRGPVHPRTFSTSHSHPYVYSMPRYSCTRSGLARSREPGPVEQVLLPGYIVGPSSYSNLPGCPSVAACCAHCAVDSACASFTYELSRHECFLKNSTEGRRAGGRSPSLPSPLTHTFRYSTHFLMQTDGPLRRSGTVSGVPPQPSLAAPAITLQVCVCARARACVSLSPPHSLGHTTLTSPCGGAARAHQSH